MNVIRVGQALKRQGLRVVNCAPLDPFPMMMVAASFVQLVPYRVTKGQLVVKYVDAVGKLKLGKATVSAVRWDNFRKTEPLANSVQSMK